MAKRIYLEAPSRTQDLLTVKWSLLAAGYVIGSTWHDDAQAGLPGFEDHWRDSRLAELEQCDGLVVVAPKGEVSPSIAALAGLAVASGQKVVWIGQPAEILRGHRMVHHFGTVNEFERQLVFAGEWIFAQPMKQAA